jgi:GNAT superfamily N-acetyltransferase
MFSFPCACLRRFAIPRILPLREQDYSDVCKIFKDCFDLEEFPYTQFKEIWDSRVKETCGYFLNCKLVAFAIVIEKRKIKYLYFFGVTPELQMNGIGTKILKHILEKVPSIYLWPISDRLKRWYERHGFYRTSSGYYNYHKYRTRKNLNSLKNL